MLPDNKLANHGKQVNNDSRSQIPSINQQQHHGAASHMGPKNAAAGSNGVRANQISPCNSGLKAGSQSLDSIGGMLKTKSKRDRNVTTDTGKKRNAITPTLDSDAKGGKGCVYTGNCVST